MNRDIGVRASRLFTVSEAVLEVVQEKGGTMFGDELVPSVTAATSGGSVPACTRAEVTEAVAFLVRMGFLHTSERAEDE